MTPCGVKALHMDLHRHHRNLLFRLSFCLLGLMVSTPVPAQEAALQVDYAYSGAPLQEVLDDLYLRYDLRFAYSSRFIPLEEQVDASSEKMPLPEALDHLFEPLAITYRFVGGQIVLRPAEVKVEEIRKAPPEPSVTPETPVYRDERMEELMAARREKWKARLPYLQKRYISSIQGNRPLDQIDLSEYQLDPGDRYYSSSGAFFADIDSLQVARSNAADAQSRLTQVSLIPFLGTNTLASYQVTNQFSVNLLWGMNGGVQGREFGGIANTIRNDVQGVQIAGLVNTVGDDMVGTQLSGLANFTRDTVQGIQVAGGLNISGYGMAVQVAGLANIAKGGFEGIQSALLYNSIRGDGNAIQLSGLLNHAEGRTKLQMATLLNTAGDVKTGQASTLLNVARRVDGFQLGLINVADTVAGVPIGLINIVRKGYNRVEFSTSEILSGNFAVRIGVKRFYNIFTIGARIDDVTGLQGQEVKEMSWGLGYGLGTAIDLSPRFLLNLEVLSWHLNEKEAWTRDLHQLYQFRLLVDGKIGRKASLFAGPTLNWMLSRWTSQDGDPVGTTLAPRPFYDQTRDGTNSRMWLGVQAGIRF